jgi:hypothetical protein
MLKNCLSSNQWFIILLQKKHQLADTIRIFIKCLERKLLLVLKDSGLNCLSAIIAFQRNGGNNMKAEHEDEADKLCLVKGN